MDKPNSLQELAKYCENWAQDDAEFSQIVASFLELSGDPPRLLAYELECIPSTINRWASGAAVPLKGMQAVAVAKIKELSELCDCFNEGGDHKFGTPGCEYHDHHCNMCHQKGICTQENCFTL